jgi:hypothetical protein
MSKTQAEGWAALLGSGWFNGKPIDASLLLPYPEESEEQAPRISRKTARILKQLEDEGVLPPNLLIEIEPFLIEALQANR